MLDPTLPFKLPSIDISTGWALDVACSLDQVAPGFVGGYLRASARRRQVIHAAFSCMPDIVRSAELPEPVSRWRGARPSTNISKSAERSAPDEIIALLPTDEARALLTEREHRLINRHFGDCPSGYLGALTKLGSVAHSPRAYRKLFEIFSRPEHLATARALGHLDRISEDRIGVAQLLPLRWRYSGLIAKLEEPKAARQFLQSLDLIRRWCPGVIDAAIDDEIRRLSRSGTVARFIAGWVRRAKFDAQPISTA